jgi:hypothetical protein
VRRGEARPEPPSTVRSIFLCGNDIQATLVSAHAWARRGREEMKMPKAKPAIQWGIVIFLVFYIVHDPGSSTRLVGNAFDFISNTVHTLFSVFSFHSNA